MQLLNTIYYLEYYNQWESAKSIHLVSIHQVYIHSFSKKYQCKTQAIEAQLESCISLHDESDVTLL